MLALTDGRYYLGVWFEAGEGQDWMACVWRGQNEQAWHLSARFRYHNSESTDPFDGLDKKSPTEMKTLGGPKTEQEVIADINLIASLIGKRFGSKPEFVAIRGDKDRAMFRLAMQPWIHLKHTRQDDIPQQPIP